MTPIAEGKTMQVFPYIVAMRPKEVVTGRNRYKAPMPGKAAWSTTTTANVFRVLRDHGVPVAYERTLDTESFLARYCGMIPIEAVGRSVIDERSSYHELYPHVPTGVVLHEPVTQLFLKTDGPIFGSIGVPDADPLITHWDDSGFWVMHPRGRTPLRVWIPADAFGYDGSLTKLFPELKKRTYDATIVLRDAWAKLGWKFIDWKGECGIDYHGDLVWADVIDNDSMRLRDQKGVERSKETLRARFEELLRPEMSEAEVETLCAQVAAECAPHFALVAEMSKHLPD